MGTSTLAWSTIVAKGLKAKVPEPMRRLDQGGEKEVLVPHLLYEDPDIRSHRMAQQVFAVLQNTLSPGSVLFEFPGNLFNHRSDAYRLVIDQIGPVVGGFRPVSMYGNKLKNQLLFSAIFRVPEDSLKAIAEGVVYNNVQYKGVAYKDGVKNGLVRVHLNLHVADEEDEMVEKLRLSLRHYGKVCDIKSYKCHGFFEGQVSALLDTSAENSGDNSFEPLAKMLYLESWDSYASASFRGAPPVCYHCRQSGHIRKSCPMLQSIKSFKCGKLGHTSRFCKTRVVPNENDLVNDTRENKKASTEKVVSTEVKKTQAAQDVPQKPIVLDDSKVGDNEEDNMSEDDDEVLLVREINRKDAIMKDLTSDTPDFANGALASRYAPIEERTTMDVEPNKNKGKSTSSSVLTTGRRNSIHGVSVYSTKTPTGSGKPLSLFGSSHRDT